MGVPIADWKNEHLHSFHFRMTDFKYRQHWSSKDGDGAKVKLPTTNALKDPITVTPYNNDHFGIPRLLWIDRSRRCSRGKIGGRSRRHEKNSPAFIKASQLSLALDFRGRSSDSFLLKCCSLRPSLTLEVTSTKC